MQNYLGAKSGSGVFQAIINLIPPHDTYIELFLGTGAVLSKKEKSPREIGIDLNDVCINEFRKYHPDVELHNTNAVSSTNKSEFTQIN